MVIADDVVVVVAAAIVKCQQIHKYRVSVVVVLVCFVDFAVLFVLVVAVLGDGEF